MSAEPNPFPIVDKLARECGVEWRALAEAARQTISVEEKFLAAIQDEANQRGILGGRVLDPDSSLVVFGSFARFEMVPGSDCDWTLLINGVVKNRHAEDARLIRRDADQIAKLSLEYVGF